MQRAFRTRFAVSICAITAIGRNMVSKPLFFLRHDLDPTFCTSIFCGLFIPDFLFIIAPFFDKCHSHLQKKGKMPIVQATQPYRAKKTQTQPMWGQSPPKRSEFLWAASAVPNGRKMRNRCRVKIGRQKSAAWKTAGFRSLQKSGNECRALPNQVQKRRTANRRWMLHTLCSRRQPPEALEAAPGKRQAKRRTGKASVRKKSESRRPRAVPQMYETKSQMHT